MKGLQLFVMHLEIESLIDLYKKDSKLKNRETEAWLRPYIRTSTKIAEYDTQVPLAIK